ncbi:alpha/beta fold hydrolase [Chondromyces apiculatus]|uniref:Proteinase (Secreted protein) n=1 Tax=Chondromyces apiculatus DSM 436 TaxID=1192034 RepID=A0A017TG24_9BACT|nr:alpha/beta fold hydrolase [Chondromyces apiculatus]EYF08184.1 proteinase (secreted protein) [Chondromyces apiculatus DSM 436]
MKQGQARWFAGVLGAVVSSMCCTCSKEAEPEPELSGPLAPVTWQPCPVDSEGTGSGAECAEISLPVSHRDRDGKTFTLFVKRLVGTAAKRRQLWLLAGGPGNAGTTYEVVAKRLADLDPTLDIYMPDHRGTGRSMRLSCPGEPEKRPRTVDDWKACGEDLQKRLGDQLLEFNITSAARDLGAAIEGTRTAGQEVHVFGESYGSLWAQRYLQLFPTQPTSVTLDSMCQTSLCSHVTRDARNDRVGREVLARCAADPFCAGKLGPDPAARLSDLLADLEADACPALVDLGMDREGARSRFAEMLESFTLRPLIPALIYRGLRCELGDVAAYEAFLAYMDGGGGSAPSRPVDGKLRSRALGTHIILSEMVQAKPPSQEELEAMQAAALFSYDIGPFYRSLFDVWPRYARDDYTDRYPSTSVPILMMNGTLDPISSIDIAQEIAGHYQGPAQTFVPLDRGVHGSLAGTPTVAPPHTSCGFTLFRSFLADVKAPVDTACVAEVQPLDFRGDEGFALEVFGAPDLWDDAVNPPPQ